MPGDWSSDVCSSDLDAICFSSEAVGHDFQACLRARRYFPSLDLGPLGQLAAYHKNQLIAKIYMSAHNTTARSVRETVSQLLQSTHAHKTSSLETDLRLCKEVLAAGLAPLIAAAVLLINLPPSMTHITTFSTRCLMRRLRLPADCIIDFAVDCSKLHA